jgi:hypothetical protein
MKPATQLLNMSIDATIVLKHDYGIADSNEWNGLHIARME